MLENPLYINDPLLDLLFNRLSWGPGIVFVLSVVIQILLVLYLTYRDNTWKDEDIQVNPQMKHPRNGHGFLTVNNLYFIFLPFLNFAIFSYYESVYNNATLLVYSGIDFHLPVDQVTETIFEPFSGAYSIALIALAFVIGIFIFVGSTVFQGKIRIGPHKYLMRTDWLFKNGRPRLVCFVFSFTVRFLQVFIVLSWLFRHILVSLVVFRRLFSSDEIGTKLLALHPDGMFGLSPLENVAIATSLVFALIFLVVASWIIGTSSTYGGWRHVLYDPSIKLAVIGFCIFAPLGVAVTLEPAHNLMNETKIGTMKELRDRISIDNRHMLQATDKENNVTITLTQLEKHETLNEMYSQVFNVPSWPLRLGSFTRVFLYIFLPAILAVAIEHLNVRRRREKQ